MMKALSILLLLLITLSVNAVESGFGVNASKHTGTLLFMANGVYDPAEQPPISVSGDYFDEVIMQRDPVEKLQRQQSALDYFKDHYGVEFLIVDRTPVAGGDLVGIAIDPTSPTGINEQVILLHSYQDTRWDYRAYMIPGKNVRHEGWKVDDASYNLVVTDPEGFSFYGSWGGENGTDVPFATVAVNGEYLIQHAVNQNKNIHISWDSSNPIFDAFNPEGFTFDCAMHSEQWGEGISFGRSMTRTVSDTGQVQTIIRNVINFPAPVSLQGE